MMKKMICMLMVLMMMAASSALAMTFDEGVAFMLDMVQDSMEAQGRTYWFTECNEERNQKFSEAAGYAYHARTSKDGKTYCTVNGHDGEMEIFTAATSVRGNYEDMIACALEVVRAYAGEPDQDMIKWGNDKGNQVLKQKDEVAFMYELKGGVLFLVEQWHETNYTAKPHYSVSVVFPCEETCPMTETVSSMKKGAQTASAGGSKCSDCDGTGSAGVQRVKCGECGGVGRDGFCTSCGGNPLCRVCDGRGSVAQYNYVFEYTTYVKCGACGGKGGCRTCDATGLLACKPCYGMGEVLVSIKCKSCDGDGRK